ARVPRRGKALALGLIAAGCGGDVRATPEGVARAYVSAHFGGDAAGLRRLWATPADLDALFTCGPEGELRVEVARDLDGLIGGLYRWETEVGFREWDGKRVWVRSGEAKAGCTARRDVELERGDVEIAIRNPEHPEWQPRIEHHGLTMLRTDHGWRLIEWSP
ncbi:MAG: hypothetical protein K8M05_17210, partial [Deltaproteobacteria bacterium]|nr:hypothetical protein [Kofleriaceae bacterium]